MFIVCRRQLDHPSIEEWITEVCLCYKYSVAVGVNELDLPAPMGYIKNKTKLKRKTTKKQNTGMIGKSKCKEFIYFNI